MVRQIPPRTTVFGQAGVQPVNTVNTVMQNGVVPFRVSGDVPALLAKYPDIALDQKDINIPNFHRYCHSNVVGAFETPVQAEQGLQAAEDEMRLNPGPGIHRTTKLGQREEFGVIWVFHVDRLGAVWSHWDPVSRSIINRTGPKHEYRDGFVIRQAVLQDRFVSVVTFGEGVNVDYLHAWNNGNFGPAGFAEPDSDISLKLSVMPGGLNYMRYRTF